MKKFTLLYFTLYFWLGVSYSSEPVEDECATYSFLLNDFFEKLNAGSDEPNVPLGRFLMFKEAEEYFLNKIPRPVTVLNPTSKEGEIIPITENYCWYTSVSGIYAKKDNFEHVFELINGEWNYIETRAFIIFISAPE